MKGKETLYKNKVFILAIVIIIIIIVSLFLRSILIKHNFKAYDKYKMEISIASISDDSEEKTIFYSLKYDGASMILDSSNNTDKRIYIIDKGNTFNLVYKENTKYEIYETENSFSKIYDLINIDEKCDITYKNDDIVQCTRIDDKELINDILKNLYIDLNTNNNVESTIIVKEDKISSYNIVLTDLEGYTIFNININFSDLESDYGILLPSIDRNNREVINNNILLLN